jgi:hypothetical protein
MICWRAINKFIIIIIIIINKTNRMRWAEHITRLGNMRNTIFCRKTSIEET